VTDPTDVCLARSALYEALAQGFRVPTARMVQRLATDDGAAGLRVAMTLLDDPAVPPLVRRLAETDTSAPVLAGAYRRLFGHTVRGEVPLFETEYGADELFLQPQELADVAGFYAAFGLTVAPGAAERPDHVSCECEFLMFLARKEAFALERGEAAMVDGTRRAGRLFLRDHLARFVPSLAARLDRADPGSFYGALGALAVALVTHDCTRLGVVAGPATLRLRLPIEDRIPMACGSCPLGAGGGEGGGGD
jgi:DMSO reductase family type II enzyme chaperone